MIRRWTSLFLAFFAVLFVLANVAEAETHRLIGDHMFDVGRQWHYNVHATMIDNEEMDFNTTALFQVERQVSIGGQAVNVTKLTYAAFPGDWESLYLAMTPDYVMCGATESQDWVEQFAEPIPYFPLYIDGGYHGTLGESDYVGTWKPTGTTWTGSGSTYISYEGQDYTTVPAGTFECTVVYWSYEYQDDDGEWGYESIVFYISPDIGVVKWDVYSFTEENHWDYSESSYTMELTSTNVPTRRLTMADTLPSSEPRTVTVALNTEVSLPQPPQTQVEVGGQKYSFARFIVDGVTMPQGQDHLSVVMSQDRLVTAVFDVSPPAAINDLAAGVGQAALNVSSASVSSAFSASYGAANTIDGDPATYWNSIVRPQPQEDTLTVDLGSIVPVDGVSLLPTSAYPQLFPSAFTIEVSIDGQHWTQVLAVEGYHPAAGVWFSEGFATHQARYVRMVITQTPFFATGQYIIQVAEFAPWQNGATLTFTSRGGVKYEARYSTTGPITTPTDWDAARGESFPALQPNAPAALTFLMNQFPPETLVHFAVQSTDYANAVSPVSNSASLLTSSVPPAAINDLVVADSTDTSLTVSFTATGDDGNEGTATEYDLRWSTQPITAQNWAQATRVQGLAQPWPAGSREIITIAGLDPDRTYYIALIAIDDVGAASALSNVVAGNTDDLVPPSAILLQASLTELAPPQKMSVPAVTSSGEYSATYAAAKVLDGNATSYWSTPTRSTPRPEHLTLDLGSEQPVHSVRFLPSSSYPQLFPASFQIEVSVDNENWTEVGAETAYAVQAGIWYECSLEGNSARYVRMAIDATRFFQANVYFIQIAEAEVYRLLPQQVLLNWTAPGDNLDAGTAASYDLRWAKAPITAANWASANSINNEPAPAVAGTPQEMAFDLDAFPAGYDIYFAITATDEADNISDLSNSPTVLMPGERIVPALTGDANGDCIVNLLDLIFIRNRIGGDVTSDDNSAADVNGDRNINLLDLIMVRNNIGNRCE